ncbi:MAG TPA: hypothetical protein PLZ67_08910 [Bacteroidales bacterium]|nr:hypothetical protein [Bacteroidales bacterium]
MKKICFVFLLMSVFGFAQNNHLNLHFNGGTSGFQLIDNGGTLIDIYDALIHEQENGMFYNASVSYLHNFGRFSFGADASWNRLQEKSICRFDSINAGSGNEYIGASQYDDYRYRFLNASAKVQFSMISHDKFSFGPYLQFGAAHIFSIRRKADFHFEAALDSYSIVEKKDGSDFRPLILNAGAGLFAQYKLAESWSLRADLNYMSFLQHWVKLDFSEKSWYRYYSAGGGIGVVYSF